MKKTNGLIINIVGLFMKGPLSPIFITAAICLGLIAVFMTPREEEPQIVVPMIDVKVSFPGRSPLETEQLVTIPLERLMWQIEGVEHVYSISRHNSAMVTVRFFVGEDRDRAMVKVRDKINGNLDIVPSGVENWLVEPVEIDDVPIVTMTLFSQGKPPYQLRRLAEEFKARLDSLRDISRTEIYGGYKREILIEPDPEKMATGKISFMDIENALRAWNSINTAGDLYLKGKKIRLVTSPGLSNAEDIANTVVKTFKDRIVKIEDIATVKDAPAEQESYVNTGFGPVSPYSGEYGDKVFPAVTLAFSKKRGTNAVAVAENIIKKARELRKSLFPKNVELLITRNYGESADEKVNDLISGMIFAVLTVIVLITITMGWREGLVVGLAVPISFSLALFVNYVSGYTINRVTLFALILSLGLVVDDPITNVDNIQRHIKTGLSSPFMATIEAVREVLPPVIMSTLAIIISFTPMFFITGMMGPYMGPMAVNVPLAVTFSTLCALTFVPWLSYNLLKKQPPDTHVNADKKGISPAMKKIYSAVITPFLSKKGALILLASVII